MIDFLIAIWIITSIVSYPFLTHSLIKGLAFRDPDISDIVFGAFLGILCSAVGIVIFGLYGLGKGSEVFIDYLDKKFNH